MKFNMKSNEVISDFRLLPCCIKSKLFQLFARMLADVNCGILNQERCILVV